MHTSIDPQAPCIETKVNIFLKMNLRIAQFMEVNIRFQFIAHILIFIVIDEWSFTSELSSVAALTCAVPILT